MFSRVDVGQSFRQIVLVRWKGKVLFSLSLRHTRADGTILFVLKFIFFCAKILYTSSSACYTKSLLPWNGYPEKSGVMVMIIWRTNSPLLIELSSSSFNLEQPFLFDHRSATDTDQRPNSSPSFFLLLFLLLRRRRLNCPLPLNPPPAPRRSP